ncbi:MAG TPA: 3-phenylpropionate dioxygenase [Alphaproteobacteria bacterium]|nr:3-phenylpropionate dioxygenase [Alphaproteobacteria bacterium]HAM47552.1 3-phenylpropionate dioxygenase [Alphaproteobacteria bacterium]HBA42653.1 3-phenylpropionate dioxygenase [Alphaproteobacteria bacterium]HBC53210.1 3-phenylpropionate dioxygenase [Alphaproteobacteria bacterium]HBF98755.1 3-phenylpropionate dioxygenase [Alphaproteobacteria bacterium]
MSGAAQTIDARLEALLLQREIEAFYYLEAELLDDRRFEEWLDLLAEDIVYFMPLRRNVKYGQHSEHENTRQGLDAAWFDEGKHTLTQRVAQIATGIHWAEEPLSRVRHLVTNVQVREAEDTAGGARELDVKSRFLVYRNRVEEETDIFVGQRTDRLRQQDGAWKVARREILLDQSTLLAKNLTIFF